MGQPKKDNTKRDMEVLKTICAILVSGRLPSLREVASESGYTNPSTYISITNLRDNGYLDRTQIGGNVIYLPPFVVSAMGDAARELLANME